MLKSAFDHKQRNQVLWFFSPLTQTSVAAPLISSLSLSSSATACRNPPLAGAAPRSTTSQPHLASSSSPQSVFEIEMALKIKSSSSSPLPNGPLLLSL
ncbi:hypothetical protein MRB53_002413 [Persea americana]|uniref:Uncharacterized protein n=1 Tax=Persea americana TaxID=3435 RepID=A0ACC2MUF6_PERAE|nr:hypothetical protein MRB53_002413 [Persea americana]